MSSKPTPASPIFPPEEQHEASGTQQAASSPFTSLALPQPRTQEGLAQKFFGWLIPQSADKSNVAVSPSSPHVESRQPSPVSNPLTRQFNRAPIASAEAFMPEFKK